ncbi:MAG: signal peptidase II [Candidatus Korobacteraceae bacterium]
MPATGAPIHVHAVRRYHFLIALAVVLLDRGTKWLVAARMELHDSISILPGFFRLTYVQNTGAAFGLFSESSSEWKTAVLVVFSLVALTIVAVMLWKSSHALTSTGIGLSLILGGALGNLWDRVVQGHVVDFFDFHLGSYHWPAFNIADSAIVVGAGLMVLEILLTKTPAEEKAR